MKGQLVSREALLPDDRQQMFQLLAGHFEGVTAEQFTADLAEKNWVVLVRDGNDVLRGFTTMQFAVHEVHGQRVTVVYSGDTIVDRQHWGGHAMLRTWIRSVWQLHRRCGRGPLYWLLITSGYRTYRFLPVFFRTFHPRHDQSTPAQTQRLLDELAHMHFGESFERERGIVVLDAPQVLRVDLKLVPPGKQRDPHVRFFLAANPHHDRGEELVTLTPMRRENLTPACLRMLLGTSAAAGAVP